MTSSSTPHAKDRHLLADSRLSLTIVDPTDAYRWVSITGTSVITEDGAEAQIDRLTQKYLGQDTYPWRTPDMRRVTVRIRPEKVDSIGFEA